MTLFVRNLFALSCALVLSGILSLLLNRLTPLAASGWLYGLAFLLILHFAFNLVYAKMAGSKDFTGLLLAGIVVKLLASLVLILIYSFKVPADFFNFSIHFILHYILFTIFEIRYLLNIIRNSSSHT